MTRKVLVLMACLFAVLPAKVRGQQTGAVTWATVGNWTVRVDRTLGDGCFVVTSYQTGSAFRVGFDMTNRQLLVLVGNDAWRSLELGKEYVLELEFDQRGPWVGMATTIEVNAEAPLLALTVDADWVDEFVKSHVLVIRYNGREVERLPLRGSAAAVRSMVECQRTMGGTIHSPWDPIPARAEAILSRQQTQPAEFARPASAEANDCRSGSPPLVSRRSGYSGSDIRAAVGMARTVDQVENNGISLRTAFSEHL